MDNEHQRARATLSAVAARAGVSASTVSLVLAGKALQRRIPEETRDRVQRAAEDLNYSPNLLTRSLRRGRTHVLSFFSSFRRRDRGDLYMDRIASAVETAGGEYGYDVLVHCNYRRSLKETYQYLNGGMADGLLMFAPLPDDPLLAMLRRSSLPVVIVGGRDPVGQYSSAADDGEVGVRLVVEEFLAAGHRHLAALGSVGDTVRDSEYRVQRLRHELSTRGIPLPDDLVQWVEEDPAPALARLMAHSPRPTGVFCWHDRLAYRVLEVCDAQGITIPDQVSIIGYDGLHWPSTTKHICSSVGVDLSAIANAAVRLLDLAITNPAAPPTHQPVSVNFQAGSTLARPSSMQRSNL